MPDLHTIGLAFTALGVGAACGLAILLWVVALASLGRAVWDDRVERRGRW